MLQTSSTPTIQRLSMTSLSKCLRTFLRPASQQQQQLSTYRSCGFHTRSTPLRSRKTVAPFSRFTPSAHAQSSQQPSLYFSRRTFASTPIQQHGDLTPPQPGEERKVTFIDREGQSHTFVVADGNNLLDIAQANDLEMEGACGGSCACSTCHVIVDSEDVFDKMEEPSDDENDMLDLAFGLTETSRLGCQVLMSKELDGMVVRLPSMTRNMQASDFEKK